MALRGEHVPCAQLVKVTLVAKTHAVVLPFQYWLVVYIDPFIFWDAGFYKAIPQFVDESSLVKGQMWQLSHWGPTSSPLWHIVARLEMRSWSSTQIAFIKIQLSAVVPISSPCWYSQIPFPWYAQEGPVQQENWQIPRSGWRARWWGFRSRRDGETWGYQGQPSVPTMLQALQVDRSV